MSLFQYLQVYIRIITTYIVHTDLFMNMIRVSILCIVFHIGFYLKAKKKGGGGFSPKHFLGVFIFLVYLAVVYGVTGVGTIWDLRFIASPTTFDRVYLMPFSSSTESMMPYFLNVIMTIPLGFLLPLIWKQFRTMKKVAFTGFLFSVSIEFSQLLTQTRNTTLDDVMMNTLGAVIGYVIFQIFFSLFLKRDSKVNDERATSSFVIKHEAVLYLVLSFFGMFLFSR